MREWIGPALVLLLTAGLVFVAWYLPRRKRVEEARRLLRDRQYAEQVNVEELRRIAMSRTNVVTSPLHRESRRGR